MKKILAISLTASAAFLGLAPAALAGGAAGAVGVQLNPGGEAFNIGAAGAIGDGTSFAAVALNAGEPTIRFGDPMDPEAPAVDVIPGTLTTNVVALNSDGDIIIDELTNIGIAIDVTRSDLDVDLVGSGIVDIDANIDVTSLVPEITIDTTNVNVENVENVDVDIDVSIPLGPLDLLDPEL